LQAIIANPAKHINIFFIMNNLNFNQK